MDPTFNDEGLSTIEDLDPEPRSRGGATHTREFTLGALLLLAVVLWAGAQWWQTERLSSTYRAASQALVSHDLDSALALFSSIPGYRDSDARVSEMTRLVAQRDDAYGRARQALGAHDWPTALTAAEEVEQIQPGFGDVGTMRSRAYAEVARTALDGLVAMRDDADPPGLYYRDEDTWRYLEGSDSLSTVSGVGPRGHLVFDAPASAGVMPRRLMLATIAPGSVSIRPLAIPPSGLSFVFWGEKGAWGLQPNRDFVPARQSPMPSGYLGYDFIHQAYDSDSTSTLTMPFPYWLVLDLSMSGDKVLLGEASVSPAGQSTATIYLGSADGQETRLLQTIHGGITRAVFSPDGTHVLVSSYTKTDQPSIERQSIFLHDVTRESSPLLIASQDTDIISGALYPPIGAAFISGGAGQPGRVLVGRWDGGISVYSVFDYNGEMVVPEAATVHSRPIGQVWMGEEGAGEATVVVWQNGLGNALPYADKFTVTRILSRSTDPSQAQVREIGLDPGTVLMGAWLAGDNLIYWVRNNSPAWRLSDGYAVYELPPYGTSPRLIFSGADSSGLFLFSRLWSARPSVITEVVNGYVRVRTYDGKSEIGLNERVRWFYEFPYADYNPTHALR